jgi:hypothetical protein
LEDAVNEIDAIPVDDEIDAIPVDEAIDAVSATPKPREVKVQRPPVSRPEAFVTRAGRAVSMGLTEPVSAAISAGILDRIPGNESPTFAQKYDFARRAQTERQARISKERPYTAALGTAAGTGLSLASPMGLKSVATLGGLTGAAEGEGVAGRLAGGAAGALLPAGFSRLPGVVQAVLPVGASVYDLATASPGADTIEAIANLGLTAGTTGVQAARGVNRFLSSRGQKAGEQVFSTEGAKLATAREAELTEAQKAVSSKLGERRALTGEQQSRLSKILELLRLGKQAGMTDLPSEESLLTPDGGWSQEAIDEAQKAVRSFIVNSPEKFTSEPARVAAQLEQALAEQQIAEAKWSNPLAVAEGMRPPEPVVPGPVAPELQAAARLLQQRELEAAGTRVSDELKTAAKNRAIAVGLAGGVGSLFGAGGTRLALGTTGSVAAYGAIRRLQQLLATDPKTKLFKDPAAANVIYDVIPSVVRKFPSLAKYASLATDAGIRARPVFLLEALQRDPDFARAVEEEVTGKVAEE